MGLTYREAGVDVDAGNELVARIADACRSTHGPEVLHGLGGFAALVEIPVGYRRPVLATGTDGVGTKLKLAIDWDKHDGIGQDLVAMCVNDVLVTGAQPLLFLDYYASGRLDVDIAERVIRGVADGCAEAGCALAGGETAEMPGMYADQDYDIAGFCVGVVERDRIIDGSKIEVGDCLLGLRADGPHANGFSLIRAILVRRRTPPGEEIRRRLLAPTRIYARSILSLIDKVEVRAMANITGGGIIENVPRMLRGDNLATRIRLGAWQRPSIFEWLQSEGRIDEREMLRTFNCGIGFVVCVPADQADTAIAVLRENGEPAVKIGDVVERGHACGASELLLPPEPILNRIG